MLKNSATSFVLIYMQNDCVRWGCKLNCFMPSSLLVFLLGQTCSLITLAGRVRGKVVSAPWPAEGVGRETRAMVAMRPDWKHYLVLPW